MVLVRPHAASQVEPGCALYPVHLHHLWQGLNKAGPGSPGCSDMFWPRRRDSYSFQMHAKPWVGWHSRPSWFKFFFPHLNAIEDMKGTDWNLANLIFRLTQNLIRHISAPPFQPWPNIPSPWRSHLLYPWFWFLVSTSENPVSMANHCSFHPIICVCPVLLISNFKCITDN